MSLRHSGRHTAVPAPRDKVDRPRSSVSPLRASGASAASLTSIGAVLGVVLLASAVVDPSAGAAAATPRDAQSLTAVVSETQNYQNASSATLVIDRATVSASAIPVAIRTPTAGTPTTTASSTAASAQATPAATAPTIPASESQQIAHGQVMARGWSESEFTCLVSLWQRESHWNYLATNRSSGAYGIAQALPGSKMASAGADWATNPATQITWGLGYIAGRYGSPCAAWGHSQSTGWY